MKEASAEVRDFKIGRRIIHLVRMLRLHSENSGRATIYGEQIG